MRSSGWVLAATAAGAVGMAACGNEVTVLSSTTGGEYCTPGATQPCYGPGQCPGIQVCSSDGTAWSSCYCGSGASGNTGAYGATGNTGGWGANGNAGGFGATGNWGGYGAYGNAGGLGQGGAGGTGMGGSAGLDGLVHCWPGEGDGADWVGGNDAFVYPDVTFSEGKHGLAFTCSGLSGTEVGVNASAVPSVDQAGPWTYEFWIHFISAPTGDEWPFDRVSTYPGYSDTPVVSFGRFASGDLVWYVRDETYTAYISNGVFPQAGQWHHVAVTREDGTIVAYLDGAGWDTFGPAHGFLLAPMPPRWCAHANTVEPQFVGRMDSIRIWNRALTAGEVLAVANGDGSCQAAAN